MYRIEAKKIHYLTCHLVILKYIKIALDKLIINGKLPKYIDITVNCPASTWCNIALPDDILSVDKIINVHRPIDTDSNVYGIIWWPSSGRQITILRINTNGTNLIIEDKAKTIKLRIWFY